MFPSAYHSSENLLICAPTGAGKTNVAMLTVLHEISQHFVHGILQVRVPFFSCLCDTLPSVSVHVGHNTSVHTRTHT